MMNRGVHTFDDPILKQTCPEVDFDEGMRIANRMIKVMRKHSICVGLAAPQIGELGRVIVIKPAVAKVIMINPKIHLQRGPTQHATELCLSYPGIEARIERYVEVRVSWTDAAGSFSALTFTGFAARVIQHEMDHLDGICRVGDEWRLRQQALAQSEVAS